MDLHAAVEGSTVVGPGSVCLVPTGVAVAVPRGYEGQVRPRSGLALRHGVTVLNSPGTVDSDYRGEIGVVVANLGDEPFRIQRGDRIAQLVVCPVVRVRWTECPELEATPRHGGGFGHTGSGRDPSE